MAPYEDTGKCNSILSRSYEEYLIKQSTFPIGFSASENPYGYPEIQAENTYSPCKEHNMYVLTHLILYILKKTRLLKCKFNFYIYLRTDIIE